MSLPEGYDVRPLAPYDAPALAAAYTRNREHLARWDPVRPEEFYTVAGQQESVDQQLALVAERRLLTWVVTHGGDVVAKVALNNVVLGSLRSASVGYWVDGGHLRRGLASGAVEHACAAALSFGLHRVDAGTLVDNAGSQRVLLGCGFTYFGTAERFLFIAGSWRDHRLYQRILHDDPLPL